MAATGTPTPNIGLRIPLGTDPASVDDINYNSNALDTVIGDIGETSVAGQLSATNNRISAVQAGLAIVCNGNTHAAIESGQFAYVKNHGTLAEGLYRNNTGSTIAANATLSSSNLTADSSGGLNTVYESLNSKIQNSSYQIVPACTGDLLTYISSYIGTNGSIEEYGICFYADGASVTNLPTNTNDYFVRATKTRGATSILIEAFRYGGNNINEYWIRKMLGNGSSYSSWEQLALNSNLTNKIKRKAVTVTCSAGTWQTMSLPSGILFDKIINIVPSFGQSRWIMWRGINGGISFLRINTSGTNLNIDETAGDFDLDIIYTDNIQVT